MNASSDPDPGLNLNASAPGRTPWYQDTRVIGILLLLVGLLALPLVWFNKAFTLKKKLIITLIAIAVAGVLLILGNWVVDVLEQRQTDALETRSQLFAPTTPAATTGQVS